jgi:hypothetical protein
MHLPVPNTFSNTPSHTLPQEVLAVRALGQTDLNPVSGVGKLSQIIFAGLSPGAVVSNVVAGAIAEAGAMQVV